MGKIIEGYLFAVSELRPCCSFAHGRRCPGTRGFGAILFGGGVCTAGRTGTSDEIIVTAQKREQLVLDVPMTTATATGEQLQRIA